MIATALTSTFLVLFDLGFAAGAMAARVATIATVQDREAVDAPISVDRPAATTGPAIEVIEAGWGGSAVSSTWTPVRLRVTGGAEDIRGLVEVLIEYRFGASPQAKTARMPVGAYGREIALPSGASLEVTMWVPAEGWHTARLSSGSETLAEAAVPLDLTRDGWPLIAVLADAPAVVRALGAIELPYQGLPIPLAVAELAAAAIPASSERFEAVSALVVQGASTAALTASQRGAVLDWVRRGGHLVIAGGPSGVESARVLPEEALPIEYANAVAAAPIGGLGEWLASDIVGAATDDRAGGELPSTAPIATFRLAPDAAGVLLAGPASAPLAWRATLGRGTVTVLAADPGIEPLATSSGGVALLRAALAPALVNAVGERPGMFGVRSRPSARMQGAANLLPLGAHPSWRVAGLILAAFAVAAGPALYLVLRFADRREASWIAIPVAAVGLAFGLNLWGTRAAGTDLITNVASYIDIAEDSGTARQSVVAAFYGPTHRELTVPLGGEVLVEPVVDLEATWFRRAVRSSGPMTPLAASDEAEVEPAEPPFRLIDGARPRVQFTTGQYTTRAVVFETERADAPRIRTDLTVDGGLLVGTVRNDTELVLEDAALIVSTNVARLGTLAPGQSATVRLDPTAGHAMRRHNPLSELVFGEPVRSSGIAAQIPAGFPEPLIVPDDPETQRRAQFLDAMLTYYGPRWGYDGPSRPLTFIAYTSSPTIDAALLPLDRPAYHLTLLHQPVELALGLGPFAVPAELIPPDEVDGVTPHGSGGGSNGTIHWTELSAGWIDYVFRPPLPFDARIEALVLKTEQIGTAPVGPPQRGPGRSRSRPQIPADSAGPAEPGVFSVYDWQRAVWVPLPFGSDHRLDADPYVGREHEVRIRISSPQSSTLRFVTPAVGVEGRVEERRGRQ